MSVSDIYDRMSRLLYYDEYEFQRIHMNRYPGKRKAERLERFLYVCPSCLGFHTMRSKNNDFFCTTCGYRVVYDEFGFFQGDDLIFDDTRKWNLFQQEETKKLVKQKFELKANNVLMNIGSKEFKRFQRLKIGSIHLCNDSFYFQNIRGQRFVFDIQKISGLNIQSNYKLEFYIADSLYRFNLAKSNICAYSIKKILSEIRSESGGENG
jgi:1-acyl-sn-glycerol-3-phosphate acyltransferase